MCECSELAEERDGRGEAEDGADEDGDGAEGCETRARAEERETAPLHALQDRLEHAARLSGPIAAHTGLPLVHSCLHKLQKRERRKEKEKKGRKQSVRHKKKEKREQRRKKRRETRD